MWGMTALIAAAAKRTWAMAWRGFNIVLLLVEMGGTEIPIEPPALNWLGNTFDHRHS
jgi:hypothetical protein